MADSSPSKKPTVLIASPLEPELVARIEAAGRDRIELLYAPDLLPEPRYIADHHGAARELTADQRARWAEMLAQAEILFDFDLQDPAALPHTAPKLRWVQATSAGIGEFVRAKGLDRSDLIMTTASGVHARPLAEFVMLGMLYFFRDVPGLNRRKSEREWSRYTVEGLDGKRMLLVGLGSLGRAIARDAAQFGVEVWGMRRRTEDATIEGVGRLVARDELREALGQTDVLVIACPLTEETRLLIDLPEIAALPQGAVVVNVGRGAVINEAGLADALNAGKIRGAALDAFAVEPLPCDSPFWDMPNVLISPHSASTVAAENGRIVDIFLDNLDRYLEGLPMRNVYERQRGY